MKMKLIILGAVLAAFVWPLWVGAGGLGGRTTRTICMTIFEYVIAREANRLGEESRKRELTEAERRLFYALKADSATAGERGGGAGDLCEPRSWDSLVAFMFN